MSLTLISYPQAIFKQTTAPTNVSAGALWWDTDDKIMYYYDGSVWLRMTTSSDAAGWESAISQVILEVLRLSAEGTLTSPDYDSMFCDYFLDADGYDGTIDTTNTTADFSTDKYINNGWGSEVNDAHGVTLSSTDSLTSKEGVQITTKSKLKSIKVVKHASAACTKAYLYDNTPTLLETQDFVGDEATFTTILEDATTYRFETDADGASYARYYQGSGISFPYNKTNFNYIGGISVHAETSTYIGNIISIKSQALGDGAPENLVVQTNAQSLSFAPAYILIHSKDITLNGTSSITFDVSFDGGSTWDSTGNNLNEKILVTDGSSKNMVVILNLNGTGAGNDASLKDYEVILWSS